MGKFTKSTQGEGFRILKKSVGQLLITMSPAALKGVSSTMGTFGSVDF